MFGDRAPENDNEQYGTFKTLCFHRSCDRHSLSLPFVWIMSRTFAASWYYSLMLIWNKRRFNAVCVPVSVKQETDYVYFTCSIVALSDLSFTRILIRKKINIISEIHSTVVKFNHENIFIILTPVILSSFLRFYQDVCSRVG